LGWIQAEQRNTQESGVRTVYSCHRLIQDAARLQIPKSLYSSTAIAKSLSEVFLNPREKFHEALFLIDFPAFLYFQTMERDIEIPLLLARYSWFLMYVGHLEEAAEWAKKAIDSSEEFVDGENNQEVAKVFRNTADVFRVTGHTHQAKEAIVQAINLLKSTPSPRVMEDVINRAIKYTERAAWISVQSGQYEEAQELCSEIFMLKEEKGGYLDEETSNSLNDLLIRIYDFYGLFVRARELALKSWETIKNSAPTHNPEALAYPLLQYIRYALMTNQILTTISLLPKASEIVQSIPNPISHAKCLSELAYIEFELGYLNRAIDRTKSALDKIDGQLQDDHPDKKKLMLHHAYLLSHLSEKEPAKRYLIKGWTNKPVDAIGVSPEGAFVFHVRQSLLLYNIHEFHEALEQSNRAIQLLGTFKPISPVIRLQAYNTLVLCLSSSSVEAQENDLKLATKELEQSLEAFNEISQIEFYFLSQIYDTLGRAFKQLGEGEKSIFYFEKAISVFDSAFAKINPGHFQYVDFYDNLALALKLAGNEMRYEQIQVEAERVRRLNASNTQYDNGHEH
jgi:tetratricopeptide (TPR) repeat protein